MRRLKRTLWIVTMLLALTGTYAIALGTLGGCGRDNDCETDEDCPGEQTCVLCSNKDVVVTICSGDVDSDGECHL